MRDSRTGLDCSLEEMALMDDTLSKGTKKSQSIQHIVATNPNIPITQIDTVESVREGKHKCLLTIHFTLLHFMLIFILNEKQAKM